VVVNGTPALDFSDVLILHLGFIGDDLVVALDANLSQFVYGERGATERVCYSNAFAEYRYDPLSLNPDNLVLKPHIREGVRPIVLPAAERLHSAFDSETENGYPPSAVFEHPMRAADVAIGARATLLP